MGSAPSAQRQTSSTGTVPPPNYAFAAPTSKVAITDAFVAFANPEPDSRRVVTIVKPPVLFSRRSYSTPLTLPIGPAYLASTLGKAGYRVRLLDCPGAALDRIRPSADGRFNVQGLDAHEAVKHIDPQTDILAVSIMFSQEWPYVREFIKVLKSAFPNAVVVIGGEHATAMPEHCLRDGNVVDYVVMGEGELTFLDLVHTLRTGGSAHSVQGVASLDEGRLVNGGLAPRLAKIDAMPWPAWHMIDLEPYFVPNYTMGLALGRNLTILATRGCPYQCTFCSSPTMWTTRYTMRDVTDVVDEIEYDVAKFGANSIDFYDLTAIVKKDWILKFTAELERRGIQVTWQLPSGTRSEALDDDVIGALARTGCRFLVYAPESGCERTLAMIKKRVNLGRMRQSIRVAVRHDMTVMCNLIIGFPFERRRDIWRTLLFQWHLALMKVDDANIGIFSPYPGSELFRDLVADGVIGPIDDEYFYGLMAQADLTVTRSVCRFVPGWELLLYRVVGMSIFYSLSYLRSPWRLWRLLRMVIFRTPFSARSIFEQRLFDVFARHKVSRKAAEADAPPAAA
jgi:radical SAM superfamily enzyme YgiQ (UPF0313 family)